MTAVLQIATVLVTMANEKYIWWLNFQQKSPIGDQLIWTKIYEKEEHENFINPRSNYQMNQWKRKMFCNSQICTILKWAVTKLNWFFWNKIHFTLLTFKSNVQLCSIRNVVTRYQVIQDVIYYMEGFNTNNSAQFKCKMFLSWAEQ